MGFVIKILAIRFILISPTHKCFIVSPKQYSLINVKEEIDDNGRYKETTLGGYSFSTLGKFKGKSTQRNRWSL